MSTEKLGREIRQEQITQAALGLIASHGLKNLSMAAIARRVGVVPSAIYRHFQSKDEVIDATLALIRDRLLENVRTVAEQTTDSLERLRLLLRRHVKLIRENQGIPRIVFSEEAYAGHPERKARVLQFIRTYLDRIGAIVRQGQQARRIRPDVDPGTVSLMFLGLIQPAAIFWHMSDGEFDVTKHTERAWKIFSEAIKAK